jgi:nicotinate-nucleotide pyrophosphorylase
MKKIEVEIEKLKRTQRAVIVESDLFGWLDCYSAEEAKRYREKLEKKTKLKRSREK